VTTDNGQEAQAGAGGSGGTIKLDTTDWKAEAQFWQLKYFEQLIHSTQVISALSRPMLGGLAQLQAAAQAAAVKAGAP
jgi:hypothetical protein